MRRNLAIKIILLLLFFSCSSVYKNTGVNDDVDDIINQELLFHKEFYESDEVFLDFCMDSYLIDFLKENKIANEDVIVNSSLLRQLSSDEVEKIFNDKEVQEMIQSINQEKLKLTIKFPDNLIYDSNIKLSPKEDLNQKRLYLSKPAITKDKSFGIIAFSKGVKSSMEGGINIYKNVGNKWKFYKAVDIWIE